MTGGTSLLSSRGRFIAEGSAFMEDVTFCGLSATLLNVTIVVKERGILHACYSENKERKKDLGER